MVDLLPSGANLVTANKKLHVLLRKFISHLKMINIPFPRYQEEFQRDDASSAYGYLQLTSNYVQIFPFVEKPDVLEQLGVLKTSENSRLSVKESMNNM